MEMNRHPMPVGAVGAGLAAAGLIAYSLVPEKLWLVTLLEGAALACLIWFLVTHFDRLKKLSAQRSTRMGANSALMVALFVAILAIVNFLTARHSVRWDFSENQNYTLAPETHRVLRGLTRDVAVTVFTREKDPGYQAYKERFDSYRQASPKLSVQFIDPERQPKVAQNYGITRTDIAIFESGPQSVRITSPAEVEITGALLRVSRDSKKRLVFLEGHGERSLEDKDRGGLAMTKEVLQKQGYDIGTVTLLRESAVPENTDVLIIAGPRRAVTQEEKERIRTYVDKGGHLMVLVDPDTQADVDDLLGTWGLELGRGVLVDLQDRLAQGDLTALLVRTFTDHEITHELTAAVLFPLARHLIFHEDKGKDWDYVPLARTSPRSWAETDIKGRVVSYNEKEDIQGPLALAAALTPKQASEEGKPRPALIIVGNSAFASNGFINFPGNSDFFQRSIGWLTEERDLISLTPKDPAVRPFVPNPLQERILLYVQVIFLPAMTFLSGLLVWRKRRRL
ncbi:MAG: Gliding motility-associated ABC transporter substrate-binding protein GldG [Nitrospira sp.]|jgi:ABC-type uncharacterized transport system involved in gliding motility auxiliary subunit|nr:MAG: Gliding motility-associated ABC transporter substrate-binding protein GldG [Nitrospira sp.]